MYRTAEDGLAAWLSRRRPKPLVLRGARQTGKSTLVRNFAQNHDLRLAEVNLERNLFLDDIFSTLRPELILREIEGMTGCPLHAPGSLLFLDEVQATPHALAALRYFYEEVPVLPVIAAGSLLEFSLTNHSFSMPVGRIQYAHLGPMTFREYLRALEPSLLPWLDSLMPNGDALPQSVHAKLAEQQREYMLVGGMPEAVLTFQQTGSYQEVQEVHRSIIDSFSDDFAKYARKTDLVRLQRLLRGIPRRVGSKVKYSHFSREDPASKTREGIDLLSKARICTKVRNCSCSGVPLSAERSAHVYKLIFLDVGLMNHICGLTWTNIAALDERALVNEGSLAEQFVGQHLLLRRGLHATPELHYWLREGKRANAEVDFVIEHGTQVVPVEVKAGKSGSLKSLLQYAYAKRPAQAVRYDLNPLSLQAISHDIRTADGVKTAATRLLSIPLYAVEETDRLLDSLSAGVQ